MKVKSLQGIFPVFKPTGITSAQLLEVIKINLKKETKNDTLIKMGHGGTLDKTASGVLVVGINQGCSKLPAFLGGGKVYRTCCVFGRATDTYNKDGQTIMEKPYEHITLSDITNSFHAFKGEVLQKPPVFSALKLHGKRLSDLVREGINVDPEPRLVFCYDIKLIGFTLPKLTFEVFCGRGFYIRSLVHDLGISLDSCAHVDELERIRQGPFETQDCLREEDCNVSGIQEKIFEMQKNVDEYLDEQMTKYRSLRIHKNKIDQPTVDFRTKYNNKKEINHVKRQSDQWYYAS